MMSLPFEWLDKQVVTDLLQLDLITKNFSLVVSVSWLRYLDKSKRIILSKFA